MSQLSFWRNLAIVSTFALPFTAAHAVDVSGRIKGSVTDPAGAVVPGAQVVATNQATGVKSTTTSQTNGDYQFQQLPIGTYTITANAPGFKSFSASGIVLNIDQEYVEPVKLDVGSANETVSVEADSVQVNTTDMQLNNIVDARQIVAYPLIGRAFTQLELILPGVQAPSDRFGSAYSVNGSQTQQSSYLVNGADTNDFALNTITIEPNVDALDQFNLITGPQNAEYSRNSGAIVSTVVKQGTNHFHGNAFEFYRDTFLNTPGFFNYSVSTTGVISKVTPKFHQNIYGGTLGGFIFKDKLFFFGAYQATRSRSPQTNGTTTNVPTALQRAGTFTGSTFSSNPIPGTLSIPGCVSNAGGNTVGADTFASCFAKLNGQLPTQAINPISQKLLAFVPLPNVNGTQFTFNPITNLVQDQGIGRLDFNPTTKDQFTGVFIRQHQPTSDTLGFTAASLPGFGDVNTSEIYQYTASYTRQLNSSTVNQLAAHYTRFNFGAATQANLLQPSTLGFAINPQDAAGASYPHVALSRGFTLGSSMSGPQPRIDQTYQLDDNFSKTVGHHSLKFGYDGRRFNVDNEFDANNSGSYAFSTSANANTSGNVYLDFLLGNPVSYAQSANGRISAVSYENYFYAQDTWKATSKLTVDIGLGYQIDSAIHNRQYGAIGVNCFVPGQQSKVFPTAPLSLNYPGDPGCNDAQGATVPYKDFGPRIGFAYSPELGFLSGGNSHKLSVRGGYGIYYNRTEEEGSLQNLNQVPFGFSSAGIRDAQAGTHDRPTFANPYQNINTGATIPNPFPHALPKPGATNITFPGNPLFVSQYAPGYRAPYAENFQLTVEREFPQQIVAIASYVGSVSRHNQITVEGNPVTQAGHDLCLADANCVANRDDQEILYPAHTRFPQPVNPTTGLTHFYSDGVIATEGSSNYNSLELSLHKGNTHGLSGQISYTFSHSLDDASSFEGAGFGIERGYNQYNKATNYGNSDFDARHRLVIAPIYAVPFHSSHSAFSLANLLGSGWEISLITTFATGHPFDVSYLGGESYSLYCSANDFYYTCPDVPNQVAPLKFVNPRNVLNPQKGQFFDGRVVDGTAANANASFADEVIGQFGNISRNKYYGPGIDNTNAQLSKNFRYSNSNEERIIQLRIEGYNVFNHTNFNNPGGNFDSNLNGGPGTGTFGVISSASASRQIQLSGKLYF